MEDDPELWALFRAVARDGGVAWPALLVRLEPEVVALARRQPIGRLRDSDDSPREIASRVFARLFARDHAAIRKLCAAEPAPVLRAWLRVIVRRSAIDYMRESPEFERATTRRPDRWISLASLVSGVPAPAPDSIVEQRRLVLATVREMASAAAAARAAGDDALARLALTWKISRTHVRRLAARGDQLLAVLAAVLEGQPQTEIAAHLGITRREVELTVRYLEELLRARFADPST